MLQNDLRAHYTNKEKPWFLITQRAKADRIRQLQSSLQSPQLHSRASRQPQAPCCQSPPLFDVPDLTVTQSSIHTTHRMLCHVIFTPLNPPDGDIHWCPVKHTWKPFKNPQIILPLFRKAYLQALPPWGGGNRISVQGTSFIAFLVQVRKLASHYFKVGKVAALFIVFSAVTGKLNRVCCKYRRGKLKSYFI